MNNNELDVRHPRVSGAAPAPLARSVGFLLAWTAATSEREYADALKSIGMTPVKVGVLELLQDGPAKQARLSDRLDVFQPVMVSVINELERAGFVERRPHPTDGRAVAVHLLPAGRKQLQAARHIGEKATDSFFAPISRDERAALHGILARLAEGR